jgi:hypothetical protein
MRVQIGDWVTRVRTEEQVRTSLAHLVDSTVAERVVTRCGKQMPLDIPGRGELVYWEGAPPCYRCTHSSPKDSPPEGSPG